MRHRERGVSPVVQVGVGRRLDGRSRVAFVLGISSHVSVRVTARCSAAPNIQSPASVTTDSIFDTLPPLVASMRVWIT